MVPCDRAEYAVEILGLASKRDGIAATPSHGDQKLLDITLALVLDESTAGMGCVCRKLDSAILMVKAAKDRS